MEAKTRPAKAELAEQFERLYYAEVDPDEVAARAQRPAPHPGPRPRRSASSELLSVSAPGQSSEGRLESFMHVEVDRQTDPAKLAELEAGVVKVLTDVRAAVEDWKPMQARMVD